MSRFKIFGLVLTFLLLTHSVILYADFKLLDAIEEFGEKRTLKEIPARIKLGPVRFHPTLRTKVTYDDNILLEDEDARGDVVFNIMPGTILEIPFDKHQLAVGYEADIEVFSKSRDAKQNDQNQNFFSLLNLHFPSWYINVLEKFSETSGRAGTTFTDRIPRFDQSVNPKVGYRWKRAVFEAGFRHSLRDFRQQINDRFDFHVTEWTGIFYYDLFARLKSLLEYQFAKIDYDDDSTRKGHVNQVRLGLQGEIFPNVTAKAKAGVQFRNYDVSSEADFNSWVADILLEYQMRENLKFKLSFSREPVEATFGEVNFYKEYSLGTGLEYKIRPQWIFFSDFRYYRHNYAERETLGTESGFRRDNHVRVHTGLRYKFREWLEFEIAYEYLYRISNFPGQDYSNNRYSFSASLLY
ncbi:MAG TPA: outer membrane beta-barrel protein [bacterium]|nr:outer membrane beta-barrel protein [bacterium]